VRRPGPEMTKSTYDRTSRASRRAPPAARSRCPPSLVSPAPPPALAPRLCGCRCSSWLLHPERGANSYRCIGRQTGIVQKFQDCGSREPPAEDIVDDYNMSTRLPVVAARGRSHHQVEWTASGPRLIRLDVGRKRAVVCERVPAACESIDI